MKNLFYLLSMVLLTLTISCNDDEDLVNPTTQNPVDVYVAGQKNNQACYWKNNQEFILNGSEGAEADTIFVSNNNIHVLGRKYFDNWTVSYLYWNNNVLTNLNNGFNTSDQHLRSITGMDVVGNDVYFVGYTKNPLITAEIYQLAYWKNGVKTVLDNNINNPTFQAKIKVVNNIVYVIGNTSNCFNSCHGVYINGVFQSVPVGVLLEGITKKNNEIYIYGTNQTSNTAYYRNLITSIETNLTTISTIVKLIFDNNNIFIADGSNIFKNNSQVYSSTFFSFYIDFTVLNDNVFILKREGDFGTYDALYINDVNVFQLFVNQGKFNSLTVVEN
jgi:hypothetical protein